MRGGIRINGVHMTDAELTEAYRKYCDMVYRIALVQTKSQAQAEDIQQDVFLALVRYSDRIRDEEHLKAWLIRVTQNACRKHFRSLWIKLTVLYDDTLRKEQETDGDGMAVQAGTVSPDPTEAEDDALVLRENVERLPEKSRNVIHLFYYEEMPIREIARCTGLTEQNVKTRLSRARDQLRQMMGGPPS